jgi:tetratricopeptide (TPR) repeat protein
MVLLAALGLVTVACGRGRRIDERLMLALEEARAWQHRADIHLAEHDTADALADVEQVLRIQFPPGAAEGEEARLDAWARLGQLHLGPTDADETRALADVKRGEAEATRDSFYRAHLETVAGEVLEARARRLAPTDPERAKAVRKEALDAYARSIAINQRVQAALAREEP